MLDQKIMMKHQHKMFRAQENKNDELVYNSSIKEH